MYTFEAVNEPLSTPLVGFYVFMWIPFCHSFYTSFKFHDDLIIFLKHMLFGGKMFNLQTYEYF